MQHARATRQSLAVMLLTVALLAPTIACAQVCDPDTEARLTFLESRLEDGQRNAKIWWGSWMTVFTIGVVAGVTQGIIHDDQSNQANSYITAGKAGLGIVNLTLRDKYAWRGADRIREIPKSSSEMCTRRLQFAEQTMEKVADEDSMRWSWKRHLWSFALNLTHGLVIAEAWSDPGTGWKSAGISEAASEAYLWTHPTRGRDDWHDYQSKFGGGPVSLNSPYWDFAPRPGGVAVVYNF
jgi:hypothetical protein